MQKCNSLYLVKINVFGTWSHSSYAGKNYICLMGSFLYKVRGYHVYYIIHSFLFLFPYMLHEEIGWESIWCEHM